MPFTRMTCSFWQPSGNANHHLFIMEDAIDLDFGTEGSLDKAHIRTGVQIIALALEELMRLNAARHNEVARTSAVHAGLAKPVTRNCWPLANACRHFDGDMLTIGNAALTLAFFRTACR